jgi:signal transduction histidine kinase
MNQSRSKTGPGHKKSTMVLSLRQRLPLFMSAVLLCVIFTFSIASYYTVKKVSVEAGKKRLHNVTNELSAMFTQSLEGVNIIMLNTETQEILQNFLQRKGNEEKEAALKALQKLKKDDNTWLLVELLDTNRIPVLWYGNKGVEARINPDTIYTSLTAGSDSYRIGKFYTAGDSVYFPIVTSVTKNAHRLGYLVCWGSLASNPQTYEQLSQLLGRGLTLYVGNADGSLWNNFIRPVKIPVFNDKNTDGIVEYTNEKGQEVYAGVQPIGNSPWLVLIEFSKNIVFDAANSFLKWIVIAGSIIIALGVFLTWLIGRNIIKPLNQLTRAASAIALGNYSSPVDTNRTDELGTLAKAFNGMAEQLQLTQTQLENKVVQRTAQLEKANAELESFSYSISHDLRAPLRSIAGFTTILEEEYIDKLDAEAKRLINVIKNNSLKMGNLIDDLLAFSRLGRNEIVKTLINTREMVEEVINTMDAKSNTVWDIHLLPATRGDANMMRQVWINLLSNAIKYSGNKERPSIGIGAYGKEGKTVFFVKDNGVGFNQNYASGLFKVFQRLHSTNQFEGTGIGLAIVEKIISKHGGSVWAESEENKGACFFFSIPRE